ncbi:HK97 family phage prohead protease [Hyphobacterium indicum]|uniref:HK97 family phage prohead protease n=1 Tax=Hyphobacterium indicum TaxID=2162714 RepID=UPI000D641470|nr:HK97 family phage prohead protease [Hyphobacterium indicum]
MDEFTAAGEPLRIEGHASLFGLADLNRDVVRRGAFTRGLQRRGYKGVRMLFQHDAGEPVGVWDEIREDGQGLFVRGRVLRAGPRGRAAAELIRQGAVDGLSIGFRTERFAPRTGGGRELLQLDLWEVSIVTFPMLPQARLRVAAPAAIAA